MAFKIPGIADSLQGVCEFWDTVFHNVTNIKDTFQIEGVTVTAKAADLNLVAGLAVGAITSGAVKYFETEVTCANGTAVETAIVTIPKGSDILDIMTTCTEAFNGGSTKTFQVGLTANKDKYIDDVDCPVTLDGVMSMMSGTNQDQKKPEPLGSAMAIVSTHTNSAGATTGKMKVKVVYC